MGKRTYYLRGYALEIAPCGNLKVCFFISKELGRGGWKSRVFSEGVSALEVVVGDDVIHVINVYSRAPRPGEEKIEQWEHLEKVMDEAGPRTLVVGDFNVHHTLWGGLGVRTQQVAEYLAQTFHQ